MSGFTKLFGSIITSSVWSEDDKTRIMWITMLATSDAKGHVSGSIPGMADIARMTLPQAEKAIKKLCDPDPYSRSPDKQGARLTIADGGWYITNYMRYRNERDKEKRREQNRKSQETYRGKQKNKQNKPKSAQAEAEAEALKDNRSNAHVSDDTPSNNGELFDRFWTEYPRKVGKVKCRQIWARLKPSAELAEKIVAAVKAYKRTDQWQKDNGEFIPHPATWLNQERWEDEIPVLPEPKRGEPGWLPTEQEAEEIMRESGIEFDE